MIGMLQMLFNVRSAAHAAAPTTAGRRNGTGYDRWNPQTRQAMTAGSWGRVRVLLGVIAAHAGLAWVVAHNRLELYSKTMRVEPLMVMSLDSAPHARRISAQNPPHVQAFMMITSPQPSLSLLPVDTLEMTRSAGSGRVTPPRPEQPAVDTAPYARQSGLAAGSGASIVLRVEVLGSGAVARVEVEVSGGSAAVDHAAIVYVHALQWIGGRVNDAPQTFWVRWGVRLDG